jgi:molecular chaperone DnaK
MYNAQAGGAQADPNAGQQANAGGSNKQDGEVTDVDFEEVK